MNLSAHIINKSGKLITFMLRDQDQDKEIVRNYNEGDLGMLRQVIASSQKYFLYLEHGARAPEEYNLRQNEMQENMDKLVKELEGSSE